MSKIIGKGARVMPTAPAEQARSAPDRTIGFDRVDLIASVNRASEVVLLPNTYKSRAISPFPSVFSKTFTADTFKKGSLTGFLKGGLRLRMSFDKYQ